MESVLLFHTVQMPVAGVPDLNRYRLHRDNAKQEVPGIKEFRLEGENKKPVTWTGVARKVLTTLSDIK